MNLKELAEQSGIGYLMDPADEFFAGDALSVFADKIAQAEREACATLCERHAAEPLILRATKITERLFSGAALDCAELIRMRSNAELTGLAPENEKTK